MLAEGSKVYDLESKGCTTFTAISARQSRITIVLSRNCNFQPRRFSLIWRRSTLSSPGHRWFASSAEAEVHAGASARLRAATIRPGRASEDWSIRLLITYSTTTPGLLREKVKWCMALMPFRAVCLKGVSKNCPIVGRYHYLAILCSYYRKSRIFRV